MRAAVVHGISIPVAVVPLDTRAERSTVLPPSLSAVQTTRGGRKRAAAGPTKEEFKAVIRSCQRAWDAREQPGADGEREAPIWSWDNARIHGDITDGESWADLGITALDHTRLPPYSPDMHSVIELSHAHLMSAMQKYINGRQSGPEDDLVAYTSQLQKLFKEMITPEWVQATTHRLFLVVLPAILAAGGNYPPKQKR